MYSVVLMMAFSGTADVAEFGRRGCHGCSAPAACSAPAPACSDSCGCQRQGFFARLCAKIKAKHSCHSCAAPAPVCEPACPTPAPACPTNCPPSCAN